MLKKLLKYEFSATARTYGALYLALVAASVLLGLCMGTGERFRGSWRLWNDLGVLLMVLYAGAFLALVIVTIYVFIQRFRSNLLGREGYLMHTLPVTEGQLVGAKLIPAVVWSVCSVFMGGVSLCLLVGTAALGQGVSLRELVGIFTFNREDVQSLFSDSGVAPIWQLALAIFLLLLAGGICLILQIYAACMIGHTFRTHPVLAAILAFFALNIAQGWIENLVSGATTLTVFSYGALSVFLRGFTSLENFWPETLASIGLSAAYSVFYFFLTRWLMKHRLDLE